MSAGEQCCWNYGGEGTVRRHLGLLGDAGGVLSSYPAAHRRRIRNELRKLGGAPDVVEVPMESLSQIFQGLEIQRAEFLSIDIEGGELDTLKSIDFSAFSTKVILVENNYNSSKICRYLRKFAYSRALRIGADDIYFGPPLIGL